MYEKTTHEIESSPNPSGKFSHHLFGFFSHIQVSLTSIELNISLQNLQLSELTYYIMRI